MKNKISIIAIIMFFTIIFLISLINKPIKKTYSVDSYTLGDVNNDGKINANDAKLVAKYIINKGAGNETFITEAADINGDNKIKMNDAMRILTGNIPEPVTEIAVTSISLNKSAEDLNVGSSLTISATVKPDNASDKTVTWSSSNENVATVDSNGKVIAIAPGVAIITAKTNNNKTATATIIALKYETYDSYEGTTLKYWFERPNENYTITRIWVEDAYNQMKVAMTDLMSSTLTYQSWYSDEVKANVDKINACYLDQTRTYDMYSIWDANTIIANEINKKNYSNKALIATNASGMVSAEFNISKPCSWYGTAALPLIIDNGTIRRDSTDGKNYGSTHKIYGLKSDGNLTHYTLYDGMDSNYQELDPEEIEINKQRAQKIINDGVKYTFGFTPVLVYNHEIQTEDDTPNIRQSFCQIDKNNFLIITNTLQYSDEETRKSGLSFLGMANIMVEYGCKNGYNLDGGGSAVHRYKKNDSEIRTIPRISYDGRGLADMLYFVEK